MQEVQWERNVIKNGWHLVLPLGVSKMLYIVYQKDGVMIGDLKAMGDQLIDFNESPVTADISSQFLLDNDLGTCKSVSESIELLRNVGLINLKSCQVFFARPKSLEESGFMISQEVEQQLEVFRRLREQKNALRKVIELLLAEVQFKDEWGCVVTSEVPKLDIQEEELIFQHVLGPYGVYHKDRNVFCFQPGSGEVISKILEDILNYYM